MRFQRSMIVALALAGSAAPAAAQGFWPEDQDTGYYGSYRMPDIMAPEPARRPAAAKRRKAVPVEMPKDARKPRGPLVIAISLDRQSLKLYDADGFYAEAPVSTGMRGHTTPMGVFSVIQKNKYHRSNIYSNAPMPYMQRLTWSGIALHAGVLPGYPASHGCIRMPMNFAVKLWSWTRMGARVIVAPGEVAPSDVSHPLLATQRLPLVAATPATTPVVTRTADASATLPAVPATTATDATSESKLAAAVPAPAADSAADKATPPDAATVKPDAPAKRSTAPIAIFISGKDGKLYARQNFAPIFETPVTITASDRPLGTHVFTAKADAAQPDAFTWSVVSLPPSLRPVPGTADNRTARNRNADTASAITPPAPNSPTEALDRLTIPDDIKAQIAEALTSASSIIVSDQGIAASGETGQGTDFIMRLR